MKTLPDKMSSVESIQIELITILVDPEDAHSGVDWTAIFERDCSLFEVRTCESMLLLLLYLYWWVNN